LKSTELVSIIVVAYNNWPDLELAVQSALCQSYRPIEVIVVDNSSTDATEAELGRLFEGRVTYIRQDNKRDSGAYNTGLRAAHGAFIQFLDGDDALAPNKIEKQVEIFAGQPDVDAVFGEIRRFQTVAQRAEWNDEPAPSADGDMLATFLQPTGHLILPLSALFRKSALDRIGPFDESLYSADGDYLLRMLWGGCRFRYSPGVPMAFYRMRPGQMSADPQAMLQASEAVLIKALQYVDREPYRSQVIEDLAWVRLARATRRYGIGVREALATLIEARATHRGVVSWGVLLAGAAAILVPGGSRVLRSNFFRSLRRWFGRLVGNKLP